MAAPVFCVLLLEVSRVRQDDGGQPFGCCAAPDPPVGAVAGQDRKLTAVVEVRVRQHRGVHRGGIDEGSFPGAESPLPFTLEQPGVDQDPGLCGADREPAPP